MALDTGKIDLHLLDSGKESGVAVVAPDLNYGPDLGAALRAVRQAKGRSLQDIADQTRVRVSYLQALEEMRLADLPARPFTLGYARAYAQALGLDPDQAAGRLKLSLPELDDELGDPIGVRRERDPRVTIIAAGGAIILLAIAGWSISQRLLTRPTQSEALAPEAPHAAPTNPAGQPIALGAPTAPPTEATAPQPYVTPGLGVDPAAPVAAGPATPLPNLGAPFEAKGKVYGTPGSSLILQATRGGQTLIIRRGDAPPIFAQVMAAGEAYGAPSDPGLTAEVSDAASFQVFAGGTLRGVMPAASTPLAKLAPAPPPAAPSRPPAALPGAATAPRPAAPATARPPAQRPAATTPAAPPTTVY
ncbi:MAG: cell division protein FtsQ [Caulobacteraceae bacterium]|nr:cell division protein FtsQ [Caulobacteraceae bacterium]